MKKNSTIDFIRIFACLLIVWNHTSVHMLNGWGNPLYWANIGVQIFFFMSGFLYSGKEISDSKAWIQKNCIKILKPYWIYLAVIFPIIYFLDASRLTKTNVIAAITGIQGFSSLFTIEGIGQHWYISYMLLCYISTPWILKYNKRLNGGGIG